MSNSVTTTTNGIVVVTHVHPMGNAAGVPGVNSPIQSFSSRLERFRKVHPKALGTVQIMIGGIMLLMGIVTSAPHPYNIVVFSGFFVWGSIIHVIAGSLTVAADNTLNPCLVKGSLGMNVVAAVTAFIGIILYSLEAASFRYYVYDNRSQGVSGVMVILSLLEFIVSICVSSFACKAFCQYYPNHQAVPPEEYGMGTVFQQNNLPLYTAVVP
ncbi:hypothetical protein UPYG_G00229100 [Umbra pygmaea]|uniref:Uncharacterized protein n=1 Tax=Umbra pygmaea TaxID=75934 RepID=A0ABD0WID4_UMBPY